MRPKVYPLAVRLLLGVLLALLVGLLGVTGGPGAGPAAASTTSCTRTTAHHCITAGSPCTLAQLGKHGRDAQDRVLTCRGPRSHPRWRRGGGVRAGASVRCASHTVTYQVSGSPAPGDTAFGVAYGTHHGLVYATVPFAALPWTKTIAWAASTRTMRCDSLWLEPQAGPDDTLVATVTVDGTLVCTFHYPTTGQSQGCFYQLPR